jgi:hypothetical protein
MENITATPVATPVEKVARIELPVIEVENFKVLDYKNPNITGSDAAIINTSDINEYAQIATVVKSCEKVLYSSGTKTCTIVVDGSLERNVNQVALLNPDLKGKVVVIHITYNGAERLRLSAKTTGTAKAKKTAKGAFFDLDLANVVELDGADYIYGKEGSAFSREVNTKIARVVKALLPYGILYSDEDKSGFHKGLTRIPVDVRVDAEDYIFFFKWNEIEAKLAADKVLERITANLIAKATPKGSTISEEKVVEIKAEAAKIAAELNVDAAKVIENIKTIIGFYYPELVIDTTKDLVMECSKSIFASLKSEKLVFVEATGTVVSKRAEDDAAKAAKKAASEAAKAATKEANKSKKAKEAVVATEDVSVDLGIIPNLSAVAVPAETIEVVTPTINAAVTQPTDLSNLIDPSALLNTVNSIQ